MLGFLKGITRRRTLGALESLVSEINALEAEISKLEDAALADESSKLKERARDGEALDAILPRAFALVREAGRRTLGQRLFDVQLMGGIVLHRGAIAEMVTGEGKTLSAVAPAYLNALSGRGVHVVTVNEYLARRDAVWMGQIYRALGLSVACLVPNAAYRYDPEWQASSGDQEKLDLERDVTGSFLVQQEFLRPVPRREAYLADIVYGTNHEFGFDYLRDNLAYRIEDQVQPRRLPNEGGTPNSGAGVGAGGALERAHHFAIIDEVDSILIDEARTPLIISAPDAESSEFYKVFARVAGKLAAAEDYALDEKLRSVAITDAGIEKVERVIGVKNIYAPENIRLVHYLEESLKAKALFHRDKDYVVKGNEVVIVDEFTGRLLHGRRYNGGLHQAIEAKEGVLIQQESRTYAKISIQNYFRLYEKISGMTGTAQTSAEEFHKVYKLDVAAIPTNKPLARENLPDLIYKNLGAKYRAVVEEVKVRHKKGQPVLLGTASIEKNELLSGLLARASIPHEVLNAKNNEREGAIIAQAGKSGAVTVATNVAGRGVDIILGGNPPDKNDAEKVRGAGGLHVIGTERHEARRIDNQLRGRAGRQGDPGSSQFFLSLEDDLVRIFGGDRIKSLMDRFNLPEDQPIQMGMVSKAVEQAQAKVEGANFDIRKHLLEYDDVLNKQRTSVYKSRQKILRTVAKEEVARTVGEAALAHFEKLLDDIRLLGERSEDVKFVDELKRIFEESGISKKDHRWPTDAQIMDDQSAQDLRDLIVRRSEEVSADPMTRTRVLSILDLLWMTNLEDLEALSESIGLRAYGQKDPLVEYRRESHRLFQNFWANFNAWVFGNIFKFEGGAAVNQNVQVDSGTVSGKVGRNDPCPCGAVNPATNQVYKYKKCGLINAPHHRK